MHILTTIAAARAWRVQAPAPALVPTMGALHAGHISLVRQAAATGAPVIASIFVNPLQFGAHEDLAAYPRTEADDLARLEQENVAAVFMPSVAELYPPDFAVTVQPGALGALWEGAVRPGHFAGVLTVVAKLFNIVQPATAIFGEKDYQQLVLIRQMARDLALPLDILAGATVREADGLALSSRNRYLDADARIIAGALPQILQRTRQELLASGRDVSMLCQQASADLLAAGFAAVDYLALVDGSTMAAVNKAAPCQRLIAAARLTVGNRDVRLIDNWALSADEPGAHAQLLTKS